VNRVQLEDVIERFLNITIEYEDYAIVAGLKRDW